jgi:hypothetical protein
MEIISKAKIETLPTEIITCIFRFGNKADLKYFRLVSQRFNDVACQMLFRSINVRLRDNDIEILQRIARDPVIRSLVREVIGYSCSEGESIDFAMYPYWSFGNGSPRLLGLHPEQARILDSHSALGPDTHVDAIANALSDMPNVWRVVLNYDYIALRGDKGYDYTYSTATFTPPGSQHDPRTEGDPCVHPDICYIDDSMHLFNRSMPERFTCRSVSVSKVHLRQRFLGYSDGIFRSGLSCYCPVTFASISPSDMEHAWNGCYPLNAFKHLRKISLQLGFYPLYKKDSYNSRDYSVKSDSLVQMLITAENLEEIELDFEETDRGFMLPLRAYLSSCTWPHLESLRLHQKNVNEEELTDLVDRHMQTLKSLCLKDICLVDAHWWTWADQIRTRIESSSLEQIEFGDLQCGLDDKRQIPSRCLSSYLLRGSHDRDCTCNYRSYAVPPF